MPVDLKKTVHVTVENFRRAESDMYFSNVVNKDGGFGKFTHYRDPNQDGSVTVQLGGCDSKTPNCPMQNRCRIQGKPLDRRMFRMQKVSL